ncbi:MAG: DUF523 domain-containing protein [Candidatus Marinimicrobia bacterium]|nr:DUF523 domain-containing protein [Candidatus Neomarinimicrobiota bacterium]
MKTKLIISACLLGINCRYDGKHNMISEEDIALLQEKFELIPACPEQLGGLSTPRLPAEIQADGKILRQDGVDVSLEFQRGADEAFKISKIFECKFALLKAKSPSCGNHEIYDGSFTGKLIPGKGQTVKLFEKHGIKVYNENEIEILIKESKDV